MKCTHNCNEVSSCIKHVPIFKNLTNEEMLEISDISTSHSYKKGDTIYNAGDEGSKLFIVYTGSIKQYRLNPNGKEQVLRTINHGDFFGELALFSSLPFSDFTEALSDSKLCVVDGNKLKDVMIKYPTIAFKIMDALSRRLELAENQVESIAHDSVDTRIINYLINVKDQNNIVTLSMTKKDLASQLGMSGESLSRSLNNMQEEGLLKLKGHKTIIITNIDALLEKQI